MAPILGYWDTRGLGQHIKLLLAYTGTQYEDKEYVCGEAPDYDKSDWTNVKEKLGMDFPNLPYYIDGNTKVTQSNAIMRYIGRKHGLCGNTEEEKVRIDVAENQAMDLRLAFIRITYEEYNTNREAYLKDLRTTLKRFSDFLGSRPWFAGDNITFVDFIIYELFDQHLAMDKNCLKDTKNLQDFQKRFENLEPIKKYMASPKFRKAPINNRMALFGK